MTEEASDPIKDLIEEAGLDAAGYAGVADALASLRDLVPEDAPAPSADLAVLLSGGQVTAIAPGLSRRRRIAVATGAAVATVLVGTGVAAANNSLPEPMQRFVSDFSDKYLPFEVPSPDERGGGVPRTPSDDTTPVSEVGKGDDQGRHVGDGRGAGKTDNPGKHNGADKGEGQGEGGDKGRSGDKPAKPEKPAKPAKPENPGRQGSNGRSPGQGQGNDNGTPPGESSKPEKGNGNRNGNDNGKKPPVGDAAPDETRAPGNGKNKSDG